MVTAFEEPMRLNLPTDQMILEKLTEGRNLAANIAVEIERNRNYINQRLPVLLDYNLVRKVGPVEDTGLYELTEKGRATLDVIDQYGEVEDFDALVEEALAERQGQ